MSSVEKQGHMPTNQVFEHNTSLGLFPLEVVQADIVSLTVNRKS